MQQGTVQRRRNSNKQIKVGCVEQKRATEDVRKVINKIWTSREPSIQTSIHQGKKKRKGMSNHEKKLGRDGLIGRRRSITFSAGEIEQKEFGEEIIVVNEIKSFRKTGVNSACMCNKLRHLTKKLVKSGWFELVDCCFTKRCCCFTIR